MARRPMTIVTQWLGIALLIPGLLRVPLPQVDFHVIRHHHGDGEVCLQHDHLLRWHPQADEAADVAVLHWHWFPPRHMGDALSEADFEDAPVLHAHDVDGFLECFWSPNPAASVDARDGTSGRVNPASSLDLAWFDAPRIAPRPPRSAEGRPTHWNDHSVASPLASLVRWNC